MEYSSLKECKSDAKNFKNVTFCKWEASIFSKTNHLITSTKNITSKVDLKNYFWHLQFLTLAFPSTRDLYSYYISLSGIISKINFIFHSVFILNIHIKCPRQKYTALQMTKGSLLFKGDFSKLWLLFQSYIKEVRSTW